MPLSLTQILPLATISTMLTLALQRKHLLMALLALEGMILTITLFFTIMMAADERMNAFILMVILTFGACEASLGLALLTSMTRSFGSDMISSLSLIKC